MDLKEDKEPGILQVQEETTLDKDTVPSTSSGMEITSPRSEIPHDWKNVSSSEALNPTSDAEEIDSVRRLVAALSGLDLKEEKDDEAQDLLNAVEESDLEQENSDDEIKDKRGAMCLTTVGPVEKINPKDLMRVVDFGQTEQTELTSPREQLQRTLGEIDEKRLTLSGKLKNATSRLTSTASLPRDVKKWAPNLKASSSSVLQKGRNLLRSTGKLFRHGKSKSYFTCHEASAANEHGDKLSVYAYGEPAETQGIVKKDEIEDISEGDQKGEEKVELKKDDTEDIWETEQKVDKKVEPKKDPKRLSLSRQIFGKISQKH